MKGFLLSSLLAVSLLGVAAYGAAKSAGGFQILSHPETGIETLRRQDLGAIYLGVKLFWDGQQRIVPVLLEDRSPATQDFLREVLHLGADQYHLHWKRRVFSGGGTAPRTFRDAAELREFVEKTPGAIGIVEPSDAETRLKVVRLGD